MLLVSSKCIIIVCSSSCLVLHSCPPDAALLWSCLHPTQKTVDRKICFFCLWLASFNNAFRFALGWFSCYRTQFLKKNCQRLSVGSPKRSLPFETARQKQHPFSKSLETVVAFYRCLYECRKESNEGEAAKHGPLEHGLICLPRGPDMERRQQSRNLSMMAILERRRFSLHYPFTSSIFLD